MSVRHSLSPEILNEVRNEKKEAFHIAWFLIKIFSTKLKAKILNFGHPIFIGKECLFRLGGHISGHFIASTLLFILYNALLVTVSTVSWWICEVAAVLL